MKKLILSILVVVGLLIPQMALTQQYVNVFLIGRTLGDKILATGDTVRVFGFAPSLIEQPPVPGPLIEANQGDSVFIDFLNMSQGHPHTIHLHGLDVDQANDGVPSLSFEVYHLQTGYYKFEAPHAGTYLYHCHVGSTVHLQAGMYGPIIIRPSDGSNTTWDGGYAFDQEQMLLMSEIDTAWHNDALLDHGHDSSAMVDSIIIPPYDPNFFLVNGYSDQQLADTLSVVSSVGAVNYYRLINLGYCYNRVIFPSGMNANIVDSDGRPLPVNELSDTVEVYPGERYGVLCQSTLEGLDSIEIQYLDINTGLLKNSQFVAVDIQGYFNIEEPENISNLTLVPNPTNGMIHLNFTLGRPQQISAQMLDLSGKLVQSADLSLYPNGQNSVSFDAGALSPGTYIISLESELETQSIRFVKTN